MPYTTIATFVQGNDQLVDANGVAGALRVKPALTDWAGRRGYGMQRSSTPPPLRGTRMAHIAALQQPLPHPNPLAQQPAHVQPSRARHEQDRLRQTGTYAQYSHTHRARRGWKAWFKQGFYRLFAEHGVDQTKALVVSGADSTLQQMSVAAIKTSTLQGIDAGVKMVDFAGAALKTGVDTVEMVQGQQKKGQYHDATFALSTHIQTLNQDVAHYNRVCVQADQFIAGRANDKDGNPRHLILNGNLSTDLQTLQNAINGELIALGQRKNQLSKNKSEESIDQNAVNQVQLKIDALNRDLLDIQTHSVNLDTASNRVTISLNAVNQTTGTVRDKHAGYLLGQRKAKGTKVLKHTVQVAGTAGLGASAWELGATVTHHAVTASATAAAAVLSPAVAVLKAKATVEDAHMAIRHRRFSNKASHLRTRHETLAAQSQGQAAADHIELAKIAEQVKVKQRWKGHAFSAVANLSLTAGASFASYALIAGAGAVAFANPVGATLAAVGGVMLAGYGVYKWARGRRMKKQIAQAQQTVEALRNVNVHGANYQYQQGHSPQLDNLIKARTGLDPAHGQVTAQTVRTMHRTAMNTLLRLDPEYAAKRLVDRLQMEGGTNGPTAAFLREFEFDNSEIQGLIDAHTPTARAAAQALVLDRLHLKT